MSTIITPYGGAGGGGILQPKFAGFWWPLFKDGSDRISNKFQNDNINQDYPGYSWISAYDRDFVSDYSWDCRYGTSGETVSQLSIRTPYGGYVEITFSSKITEPTTYAYYINGVQFNVTPKENINGLMRNIYDDGVSVRQQYTYTEGQSSKDHLNYFFKRMAYPYLYDSTYAAEITKDGSRSAIEQYSWENLYKHAHYLPAPANENQGADYARRASYIIPFNDGVNISYQLFTPNVSGQSPSVGIYSDEISAICCRIYVNVPLEV